MSLSLKTLALAVILAPGLAVAATAKKTTRTTTTTTTAAPAAEPVDSRDDDTLAGGALAGGGRSTIPAMLQNRLSLFAGYDFADSIEVSGGTKADTERAFVLGAQYEFPQLSPGIAAQVGGTYEFAREVKNSNGLKVQTNTIYGELVAKVVPQFKLVGGINYNFPSMSNAAAGASIKGKVGFQFGAIYQLAQNIAIDGHYRALEMETSAPNGQGGSVNTGVKSSGFVLGGRYIF